tara:strand:- start:134 stop:400 length:267 start_codon:yes stop_codon:yes gene_type:complete
MSRWWKKFKVKQKKTTPDFNKRRRVFREATRKGEVASIQKELRSVTGEREKMSGNIMKDKAAVTKKASKALDRTQKHLKTYEDVYKKK